uniref:Uncharacterized protein n=1 Tax=Amphimedon queenslandica TaxID=400682 RepID=A0A1X7V637_AMPQE
MRSIKKSGKHRSSFPRAAEGRSECRLPSKKSIIGCSLFLRQGGLIHCTVSGSRRYSSDLEQSGLEIPCKITFGIVSIDKLCDLEKKAKKLVKSALSTVTSTVQSAETERISEDGPEPKRKQDKPRD